MPAIRVLVVDDAVVMRRLISEALTGDPEIEVVGTAAHGKIALAKIPQVNPDVITMDVEMPELDGIQTVKALRVNYPKMPVIMLSTSTQQGAVSTLDAMAAGATDFVTKPSSVSDAVTGIARLREELVPRIKSQFRSAHGVASTAPVVRPGKARVHPQQSVDVVAIGTSTGGPNALADVIARLPADINVPVVIVQHMPPSFTAMLADRLGKISKWKCCEGVHGQPVQPGVIHVAPGGKHMEVSREGVQVKIVLHEGPPENSCRPAVDVLFRSVARVYGGKALGVVLTGMGQDGMRGCQHLAERGADIFAQDEASSVVWGMPGSVVQAGLATKIIPLSSVAAEIADRVRLRRPVLTHS